MNKIRLLGMAILLALVCAGITACSKSSDDEKADEGNNYKSLIIGKWKLKNDDNYYTTIATHVEFKKDGTFSWTSTKEPYYEEHGVYKIDGDILYWLMSDEDDWGMSKIILLNSISFIYKNIKDDGELSKTAYSFQRDN